MLSYRAWQQEYGADPKVVGASFMLDGHPFTIVGITPPGFYGETLRSDPPELLCRCSRSRCYGKEFHSEADECMAARDRPAAPGGHDRWACRPLYGDHAAVAGHGFCGPGLKEYLPQIKAMLPKQNIKVIPAGAGVGP